MKITSKISKIIFFLIFNIILLIVLYNIPVGSKFLSNICLIKMISGRECWNCGMTRAFLSLLHFKFALAYNFNHKVILVFPLVVFYYLYLWALYIFKKKNKNEWKRKTYISLRFIMVGGLLYYLEWKIIKEISKFIQHM